MSPKSWRTSSLKVGVGVLEVVFVVVVEVNELVVTGELVVMSELVVVDELVLVDEGAVRERPTTTTATMITIITIATVNILEIAFSLLKYGLKVPTSILLSPVIFKR